MVKSKQNIVLYYILACALALMFSQEALHNHAADNEGGHAECPVCLVSNTAPAAAVLANYNNSQEILIISFYKKPEQKTVLTDNYNSSCFPDRAPPKI